MNMNGYLTSVVFASGLGVLSDIITVSYGKNSKGTEKYVKLAVSLCVLACIILPAVKSLDYEALFVNLEAEESYNSVATDDNLYILERECEDKASSYIFEKTGIKPVHVVIDMKTENQNNAVSITKAEICILPENKDYENKIRLSAREALGVEVDIVYEQ